MISLSISRIALLLALGSLTCLGAAWARTDVPRHALRIVLFPEKSLLEGSDTLMLHPGGASGISLRFAPVVEIERVTLEGRAAEHRYSQGHLRVSIPPEMRKREIAVRVEYRGTFRDKPPEAPAHTEDPTFGVDAVISPRGTFLGGGSGWYPQIEEPALYDLTVIAPKGVEAVTAGRRMESEARDTETVSSWRTAHPLPNLTLSAGPYHTRQAPAGPVPVHTYFYADNQGLSETYLDAARGYLEMYGELFGPYPFEKFAVVENFFPTGYGFPSWTLLGSSVVRLPFIVNTSLGHEIAHSWWGTGVRVDYSRGNWSEGLTTYVADHRYKELESAAAAREYRLTILRDYASLVHPQNEFPLSRFTSRDSKSSQAIGYGKAAMVFHMARKRIGDRAFWTGLKKICEERMYREAAWHDFAVALGEAGGSDLTPFFEQWVEWTGAPVLLLENVTVGRAGKGWQISGILAQKGKPFDLQVPLVLESEGEQTSRVLTVSSEHTPFSFQVERYPSRLIVDPQVDLFRRLDPVEIPPSVNAVRGATRLRVVVSRQISSDTLAAARELLSALRKEDAPLIQEEAADAEKLKDSDLLFIGLPANRELLPPLPEELELGPERFRLQGEYFDQPGAALFATLPRPGEPERVAAVFLPLSPQGARMASRKIPHYGKYGFLAFVDGENRSKGTWSPGRSPTIHHFPKEPEP